MSRRLDRVLWTGLASTLLAVTAFTPVDAQDVEVIYAEVPGSTAALVPGAVDLAGQPVATEFNSILDMIISPDGSQWIVKASTTQSSDEANVLLLGSGAVGTVFAQEGQPVAGGLPGENYEFFDGVGGFNSLGQFAFGARARDGDPDLKEKVIFFDGVDFSTRVQESDPALGLMDLAPAVSGDETFGNSLNSIHLLDDGRIGFVAVTISDVHSSRRPALFYDNDAFLQSGVSMIGSEIWDSFDSDDFRTTLDGLHWYAQGDTENADTGIDDILAVDGVIVVQEGMTIDGVDIAAIFNTWMNNSGDWISRGDDPADNDWVILNGSVIAKTGDPVVTGGTELWGPIIATATINDAGVVILAGQTDAADVDANEVLVVDGQIVLREGDPIDLDGNGSFDDDTFLRSIQPDDAVLNGSDLYILATLRNSVGDNLGDAFLRIAGFSGPGEQFLRADCNVDGTLNIADAVTALESLFVGGSAPACPDACDMNDDGGFDVSDPIFILSNLFSGGPDPAEPFPACGPDPTADGLDCPGGSPSCP